MWRPRVKQCTNQADPEYEVDLKWDESNGTLFFASETVFSSTMND